MSLTEVFLSGRKAWGYLAQQIWGLRYWESFHPQHLDGAALDQMRYIVEYLWEALLEPHPDEQAVYEQRLACAIQLFAEAGWDEEVARRLLEQALALLSWEVQTHLPFLTQGQTRCDSYRFAPVWDTGDAVITLGQPHDGPPW